LAGVLGPLPQLLIAFGNALTPGKGFRHGPFTSEAELRDLVDLAEASKVIESDEREMIHSVFELGDTIVREVMVPRTDIVFIERTKTLRQAMSLALRSGFSRLPVVGENEDDVVGIIYLRDLARRIYEYRESESTERIDSLMRPATFVPDSKPVGVLLREMQAERIHLAIVVDEYGGTAGIVTLEDLVEKIVGEVRDEHDPLEVSPVRALDEQSWIISGLLRADEVADAVGFEMPDGDYETVAGLVLERLGRIPDVGDEVALDGWRLTVVRMDRRRIADLRLTRTALAEQTVP
jgi:CBS domain containing-hemolysin-like protein